MAAERVLADTSLFIEHLRSRDKTQSTLYRALLASEVETCAIVAAEVLVGARTPESEANARSLLRPFVIHAFTAAMAERLPQMVQELRARGQTRDLRDLMIAATAAVLGLPIATLNRAHFEDLSGVRSELPPVT